APRKRRHAMRVIAVLVCYEDGGDVARLAIDGAQALFDDLTWQTAVHHQQRGAVLDEGRIAATAAAERCETQRHWESRTDAPPCRSVLLWATLASLRRVHRHWKLRDVTALGGRDLAHALLVDLVDPQHVVHGEIRFLDARKLDLQPLDGRIDDDGLACI